MTEVFEFSEPKRENLIYHFATMTADEAMIHTQKRERYEAEANVQRAKQAAERAAKHPASAPAAVKSPPWKKPDIPDSNS